MTLNLKLSTRLQLTTVKISKMADVEAFDLEIDFPKFLEFVVQKTENIFKKVEEQSQIEAEVHVKVVDQSISLIRALRETTDIQPSDKIALDSLARAFTNVLALLQNHITYSAITPTTLAASSVTIRKKMNEKPGRPFFEIPAEMLEELRSLGFSWTKTAEFLGVSRWTQLWEGEWRSTV